jgi:hypothetical protein
LYAGPVQELIDQLGRLPGVGPKSAQRIAFYLLKLPKEDAERLAQAIIEVKARISFCRRCWNVAEGELCDMCSDTRRDPTIVCVVEEPRDIVGIDGVGIDVHRLELHAAGDSDLHDAATRLTLDDLLGSRGLGLHQLLLHLLSLLEEVVHVGLLRHGLSYSSTTSAPSNACIT